MREIVFDTETTGREAENGDRIVEIGCVELYNLSPTGRTLHFYCNPERDVSDEVVRVHGLTGMFLRDKPLFGDIADKILEFFEDAPLIAHNSEFDRRFLYAEFGRVGKAPPPMDRFVDTLQIARKRFPGASCSLDALAKRFQLDRYGFDLSARKGPGGHGALVDAKILAEVYLQLKGGREQKLMFEAEASTSVLAEAVQQMVFARRDPRPDALPSRLTAEEQEAHAAFVEGLGAEALWKKYG
ncbi:MAG TPA: DNA polymerase III subunit epsilon [Caulobacterales bacterium]|nr:DNA polymerase III subunit epsilon [Caulobacterales bacterium]